MRRSVCGIILLLLLSFVAFAVFAAPCQAAVLPNLQVGIADGSGGFVPYTTQAVPGGSDEQTAFTTDPSFRLALAGTFQTGGNNPMVYLGGSGKVTYGSLTPLDVAYSDFSLGFLSPATGAVLIVTVPEGSAPNLGYGSSPGTYPLNFVASRTGDQDSGFPNSHFPVGSEKLFDFFYYDLVTPFAQVANAVGNFAESPYMANATGEVRYFDLAISGVDYAHFDLMAIEVSVKAGGSRNATLVSTLENSPNSHDASYNSSPPPIPEPGTVLLLGTGLIGLAAWGRKRRLK